MTPEEIMSKVESLAWPTLEHLATCNGIVNFTLGEEQWEDQDREFYRALRAIGLSADVTDSDGISVWGTILTIPVAPPPSSR